MVDNLVAELESGRSADDHVDAAGDVAAVFAVVVVNFGDDTGDVGGVENAEDADDAENEKEVHEQAEYTREGGFR